MDLVVNIIFWGVLSLGCITSEYCDGSDGEGICGYKDIDTSTPDIYFKFIERISDKLVDTGFISYIEHVGSKAKETNLEDSDLDVLFVKRDEDSIVAEMSNINGYAFLKDVEGTIVEPKGLLDTFKGKLQKILNSENYADYAKLIEHGPAIEIRYFLKGWRKSNKALFVVDFVLCYEVKEESGVLRMFVAKQPEKPDGKNQFLWRISTSFDETKRMSTANEIGRWAVRFMKALTKEPGLKMLTCYTWEQAFWHLGDKFPSTSDFWKESNIKNIIKELLKFMTEAVDKRELRRHHWPHENIMPEMSIVTSGNIANRLRRLSEDPDLQRILDIV